MKTARIAFALFLVLMIGSAAFAQKKQRVAVLPFQNVGEDRKYDWLSDGFSETLAEAILQVQSVYIVSTNQVTSVMRANDVDITNVYNPANYLKIGKILEVDLLITGGFLTDFDDPNIKASARVIDMATQKTIQDCKVTGLLKEKAFIFQMYDEIVDKVTACIGVALSDQEVKNVKAITENTSSFSAYEYYIRGRKEHLKFSVASFPKAVEWYQKAIEVDDQFTLALAAMGETYAFWAYQKELNNEEYQSMYDVAVATCEKAVQLAPELGSVRRSLAVAYAQTRQWDKAEVEAQKAVDLNPNDAESWFELWVTKGYKKIDSPYITKTLEINPALPSANLDLGVAYYNAGNKDKSLKDEYWKKAEYYYLKSMEVSPDKENAHYNLGLVYTYQATPDYPKAIERFKRAVTIRPNYVSAWGLLGYAYEMSKQYDEALEAYKTSSSYTPKDWVYYGMAYVYSYKNDWANVVASLEKCLELNPDHTGASNWLPDAKAKLAGGY